MPNCGGTFEFKMSEHTFSGYETEEDAVAGAMKRILEIIAYNNQGNAKATAPTWMSVARLRSLRANSRRPRPRKIGLNIYTTDISLSELPFQRQRGR